ncbi:ATP-dependent DNA ligase I [Thioflavicoccus mobilis 8321]|uniref:Probable DNA ligase n=2 Tax=Thioflavicoccus mobilis TaxID=80679 RepID=L0GZV9_9GAMM|nr:ATP-dependent DNA ligase I [Thioflavicoccus mobilis 8321]
MRLNALVETSAAIAATPRRSEKVALLADCLGRLDPTEIAVAVHYLSGTLPQGRIGLGPAILRDMSAVPAAAQASLDLATIDRAFTLVAAMRGSGSQASRATTLAKLFSSATLPEQSFLSRLVLGELRQGALEGVMTEAIARAARLPLPAVRQAMMLAGDGGEVARAALIDGATGLVRFRLQVMTPVKPMLAQPGDGPDEAVARLGEAALEYKLDGARVQVHRVGDAVRVFTRRLNEVTSRVPEVVQAVLSLPVTRLILDGEVLALGPDGRPQPFQVTMRRFGRRSDPRTLRQSLPLSAYYFDCLHADGEDLIGRPLRERLAALDALLPPALAIHRRIATDPTEAEGFLAASLAAGHEGIMVKALDAPYEAGSRGAAWLKVKPAHTLDLVVLAAEWGSGRRRGWLSNLHLSARDPQADSFVMLGKTFKGLTDRLLAWQTEQLLARSIAHEGPIVHVRPELVVEIAFDSLQASPQYPGGLALRFARVKRYRTDKDAAEADTIETVRRIYEAQSRGP